MAGGSASEAKGQRVGSSGASGLGRCFCRVGTSGVGPGGILCSKEARRCRPMGGEHCHRIASESRCVARGNHKMHNRSGPLSPEGVHTYAGLHSGSIYGPLYAQFYHLWPQVTKVTKVTRVERGENVLSLVLPQHAFFPLQPARYNLSALALVKTRLTVRMLSLVSFFGAERCPPTASELNHLCFFGRSPPTHLSFITCVVGTPFDPLRFILSLV